MVFRTEEGSLAKSGFAQPAFLNFDAELLYPPAHHMQVRCASLEAAIVSELAALLHIHCICHQE